MVILASAIVTFLTSFLTPVGLPSSGIEGSERFGLVVDDPREMSDEQSFVGVWQHCP